MLDEIKPENELWQKVETIINDQNTSGAITVLSDMNKIRIALEKAKADEDLAYDKMRNESKPLEVYVKIEEI